jgi:hypothetical protein
MFPSLSKIVLTTLGLVGLASPLAAQISLSPYSRYGIGDLIPSSSVRNFSMGNVGIGMFDGTTINRINPASYADLRLTTFEVSGFGAYSMQKSNVNTAKVGTAGFYNTSMGFANRKGFGIVAGLSPASSNGYNVVLQDSVFQDTSYKPYTTTYSANGGLNQFYLGAGVRLFRHLNVGVNLNIAFGATNFTTTTDFSDNNFLNVNVDKRVTLTGLMPQFGMQYGDTLRIRKEIERTKALEADIKGIEDELRGLDREEAALKRDNEGNIAKSGKYNARIKALEDERKALEQQIEGLMKDEVGNEKALRKLQEESFRVEKKRKKLQRDLKTFSRGLTEAEQRIAARRAKLQERKASVEREIEEVKAGRREATETKKQLYLVRAGGIFEPGATLKGERLISFDNSIVTDSVSLIEGSAKLPMKLGFGLSFGRPNRWSIGADFSLQDWSKFQYFNEANVLQSAISANLGGEWIPNLVSKNYASRIAFRAGVYYNGASLTLNNTPVTEVGVNLGVGLPIGFFNAAGLNFSRVNLGFGLGHRGTLDGNLLEETTFNFRLGVNLNDIWFIKRRID